MPSVFNELFASACADAIEPTYGVALRHIPRRDAANVNAAMEADPTRDIVETVGVVDWLDSDPALSNLADSTMNRRAGHAGREHIIDVSAIDIVVRRGDVFEEVETGRRWVVQSADPDDARRYNCRVNAA